MVFDNFLDSFQIFLIVLTRLIGLFATAPFFSGEAISWRMKIGFGFLISMMVVPMVVGAGIEAPADMADFGIKLLSNFVTGAGIGFFIYLVITSFQISAQIFSLPMGLGMNEVVDPMSQIQVPALGNILAIMIILLLIRVDGHFYMIRLVTESFSEVDMLSFQSIETLSQGMFSGLLLMFDIGLKISLPIVGITLLLDVAMGMISRVAPQFNVMIMGFNIKLLAGFLILWLTFPVIINLAGDIINQILDSAEELIFYLSS